jgi:hypothetical protein
MLHNLTALIPNRADEEGGSKCHEMAGFEAAHGLARA